MTNREKNKEGSDLLHASADNLPMWLLAGFSEQVPVSTVDQNNP